MELPVSFGRPRWNPETDSMSQSFAYRFLLTAVLLVGSHPCAKSGEPEWNDEQALTTQFHREFPASNVLAVHRQALRLPPDERYRFLCDLVWLRMESACPWNSHETGISNTVGVLFVCRSPARRDRPVCRI